MGDDGQDGERRLVVGYKYIMFFIFFFFYFYPGDKVRTVLPLRTGGIWLILTTESVLNISVI